MDRPAVVLVLLVAGSLALPAPVSADLPSPETGVPSAPTAGSPTAMADSPTVMTDPKQATVDPKRATVGPRRSTTGPERATVTSADAGDIRLEIELALAPDRPGEIAVRLGYRIPDRVRRLDTTVPSGATVRRTTGFSATGEEREYAWDGTTEDPSLVYLLPANRTTRRTGPEAAAGRYLFVDPGPWALVSIPPTRTAFRYVGTEADAPSVVRTYTTAGPGAVGGSTAFLGPASTYRRTADGQTFRLVVPDRAAPDLAARPAAVLDALANASGTLSVGARDGEVFVVAAPTGADWGVRGLQSGDADAWVVADSPLDTPNNVWFHEYVHTRQAFETTEGTEWFVEGSATYYAAALALRQGHIGFDAFRRWLATGATAPQGDAVLADPTTWSGHANYRKGALVAGDTDRRLRLATDGRGTLDAAVRRLNRHDGPVDARTFLRAVEAVGSPAVRDAAERHTTTDAVPDPWSRSAHRTAFDAFPARFVYRIGGDVRNGSLVTGGGDRTDGSDGSDGTVDAAPDGTDGTAEAGPAVRVRGPYRNRTLPVDGPVVLVHDETLVTGVVVRNVGGERGDYSVAVRLDGTVVARRSGTLGPGERAVETVERTFDGSETGSHTLSAEGASLAVEVRDPARARVVETTVDPRTVRVGEPVTLSATVANRAAVPGRARVVFTVDGDPVARRTVALDAGGRTTVSTTHAFDSPGRHRVGVANASGTLAVDVGTATPRTTLATSGDRTTPAGTRTPVPGFGPVVAAVALAGAALLALRRGSARP